VGTVRLSISRLFNYYRVVTALLLRGHMKRSNHRSTASPKRRPAHLIAALATALTCTAPVYASAQKLSAELRGRSGSEQVEVIVQYRTMTSTCSEPLRPLSSADNFCALADRKSTRLNPSHRTTR